MLDPATGQKVYSLNMAHIMPNNVSVISNIIMSNNILILPLIIMLKEMATHSSILAWRIPGMGEPGGLLPMGSHRVGHD